MMFRWREGDAAPLGNLLMDYMQPDLHGIQVPTPDENVRDGRLVAIADRLDSDILEEEEFQVRLGDGYTTNSYNSTPLGVSTLSTGSNHSTSSVGSSGSGQMFMSPSGYFFRAPRGTEHGPRAPCDTSANAASTGTISSVHGGPSVPAGLPAEAGPSRAPSQAQQPSWTHPSGVPPVGVPAFMVSHCLHT